MQSKTLCLFLTTSGWLNYCYIVVAFHSIGDHSVSYSLPSPSSSTSRRSNTPSSSLSASAVSSSSTVMFSNDIFQLSDSNDRTTTTTTILQSSRDDAEFLLQKRPFVIVEGRLVRNDIMQSIHEPSSSSPTENGNENESTSDTHPKEECPPSSSSRSMPSSDTFTSKQFLTSFPSGAYTTSRTVQYQKVLRLQQHLSRMAESARLIITAAEPQKQPSAVVDHPEEEEKKVPPPNNNTNDRLFRTDGITIPTSEIRNGSADSMIETSVRQSIAAGIASFEHLHPASTALEKRITTLLLWEPAISSRHTAQNDDSNDEEEANHPSSPLLRLRVLSYIELLPPPPTGRIVAQLCQTKRTNALAKDSQWVLDRKKLELERLDTDPPVHEVLLTSHQTKHNDNHDDYGGGEDGAGEGKDVVLEGLSSNFFAVSNDGIVYTASKDDGVLLGTLRSVVLRVCAENNIEVVEKAPVVAVGFGLGGGRKWVGAFVTSTTRLALPVTDLIVPSLLSTMGGGDGVDVNEVDIINFSYGKIDGIDHDNLEDGVVGGDGEDGSKGVRNKLGLDGDKSCKVGECVAVHDSRGIMKIIVEGVHAAVLSESECPW